MWDKESSISTTLNLHILNEGEWFENKSGAAETSLHTFLGHEIKNVFSKQVY